MSAVYEISRVKDKVFMYVCMSYSLKTSVHITSNCLYSAYDYLWGLNGGAQNNMETWLAHIATMVLQPQQELGPFGYSNITSS